MKSELSTKEITALRNELQDLLESAYAAVTRMRRKKHEALD